MKTITLSIGSDLEQVSLVCGCVSRLCIEAGLDEATSYQMELCASEALTNIVDHAYSGNLSGELRLTWTFAEDRLTMEIADRGKPMATPPNTLMPPANSTRGRGWPLISELMDEVSYSSSNHVNQLRLIKHLEKRGR